MANRFWVGGGSSTSWAATANTNWAATSGAANNQSVPTTTDVAIFDSNSGVANSVIGANITIQGLDCTGGTGTYAGTITHNSGVTLTINTGAASSLRLSSGMTYTPAATSSIITLTHTTGTANITSNGKRLAALTINGAGGTTQLLDALRVDGIAQAILTVTTGIFDANNGAGGPFAVTAYQFSSSNSNTRSIILGGTVTLGGAIGNNATIWSTATTTGLTFTKNSANIVIAANANSTTGGNFAGGSLTFNNLTLNATSTQAVLSVTGTNTFSTIAVGAGWTVILPNNATTTASGFTMTGTQSGPVALISGAIGAALSTLSVPSGACTVTWGAIEGITGSGGATFTATNTLNLGNTSGWTIAAPADATLAAPTAAQVATAVWQDTTAGDFTTAGSIGKDLFVGGIAPGAAGGHFIAGTNAATSVTTALTANITGNVTGNLSGSVGSVTSRVTANSDQLAGQTITAAAGVTFPTSVASPTNITAGTITTISGNVTGSVGSVTARVTANSDQIAGSATAATNLSGNTLDTTTGVVGSGSTTTSIVTSSMTPPGSIANQFGSNVNPRYLIFDSATTTAALRNQSTVVSASTNAAAPVLTVNALTTAPVATDTFRMP